MPTASHNLGARLSSTNATGTVSSFPTGGPLLNKKHGFEARPDNHPAMEEAGAPLVFPETNLGERGRPADLVGSMHRAEPGLGRGAYRAAQMAGPGEGYAPQRPLTRGMTMARKGTGSFYRQLAAPHEGHVDDDSFKETYLRHGGYAVSERSEVSALDFGAPAATVKRNLAKTAAKAAAAKAKETRASASEAAAAAATTFDPSRSGNPVGLEMRRSKLAVSVLSSGAVGRHAPGHPFSAPPPKHHMSGLRRLDVFATADRKRLVEHGQLGDFTQTSAIHEARRKFRREQRRELHGKLATMSGKLCGEALRNPPRYKDKDASVLGAPSGPRNARIGVGVATKTRGDSPRAKQQREQQSSGAWGAFTQTLRDYGEEEGRAKQAAFLNPQPSGRRGRFLGMPCEGKAFEGGGQGRVLRSLRPHTVGDLQLQSSTQVGQFWTRTGGGGGGGGGWAMAPNHGLEDLEDAAAVTTHTAGDDEGGQQPNGGQVAHWSTVQTLHPRPAPSPAQQEARAKLRRDLLTSAIVGSHVSARGPRPNQAVDFNEPKGCALKPAVNKESGFQPPMGVTTDGMPLLLKHDAPRAATAKCHEWRRAADKGGVSRFARENAFHKSASGSFLAAAQAHELSSSGGRGSSELPPPPPIVGVEGTATARGRSRRAVVERSAAADRDLGWSHCLRGQKW